MALRLSLFIALWMTVCPAARAARQIGGGEPLDRGTDGMGWCPSTHPNLGGSPPFNGAFIADGPSITVRFTAAIFHFELGNRQGVQPQQMVAPLQRVAAEPVEVKPPATGHEDPLSGGAAVVDALHVVAPAPVLVDLVEHPEFGRRQLAPEDLLAVGRYIPVQVPLPLSEKAQS